MCTYRDQGSGTLRASRHEYPDPFREAGEEQHGLECAVQRTAIGVEHDVDCSDRRLRRVPETVPAAACDRVFRALVLVAKRRYQRADEQQACVAAARAEEPAAGRDEWLPVFVGNPVRGTLPVTQICDLTGWRRRNEAPVLLVVIACLCHNLHPPEPLNHY